MDNTCFICGLDKNEFTKNKIKFRDHKKSSHNMWNYVNYMLYLKFKDYKELSNVEKRIKKLIDN